MINTIKHKLFSLCLSFGMLYIVLISQNIYAQDMLSFIDVSSAVIKNSAENQPKNSFLQIEYKELSFAPVWIEEDHLSSLAKELLNLIKNSKTLDKNTKLYNDAIRLETKAKSVYSEDGTLLDKVDLEFKFSQLYKGYADYRLFGGIKWNKFKRHISKQSWTLYCPKYSPLSILKKATVEGDLKKLFNEASPKSYHYVELKSYLEKYINIEKNGGWPYVPLHRNLRVGKSYNVVPILRERLRISGEYKDCDSNSSKRYSKCLKDAVISFQKSHGLVSYGIINKSTIKALNIPIKKRIEQIRLNLDRIKWLHEHILKRDIIVNIPAFTLFFEDNGNLIQTMRVIIGRKTHPTPIFSNIVETIVLNPRWNVPKSIIQKEMIPKLLRNSSAMSRKGIEIYTGWGKNAKKISGASVNWRKYRYSRSMPYRFSQVPGNRNALGKVKFLFPNCHSVYMHDTPNKRLFKRNIRAFSHGCIRLSQPRELLKTFSTFNKSVNYIRSKQVLKGRKNTYLRLDNKVSIDIVYLTAYVDYDGVLNFRDDIYGYDRKQLKSYIKW